MKKNIPQSILFFLKCRHKTKTTTIILKDLVVQHGMELNKSLVSHINATYRWICAAQDVTPDRGVSGWFNILSGWKPSYPETTGYIIPTMLSTAKLFSDHNARMRALAMADWEIEVQLPSGAVRSGPLDNKPAPAVFNTGQVIFGWTAAYQETSDDRYIQAAQRAAKWLADEQDKDGAWRRHLSLLTHTPVCTYNARTAWALVLLGKVTDEQKYINAGKYNLDWCLTQQHPNGWFSNNGFQPREIPLLHTIGYVIEGLLEAGVLLNEDRYIDKAKLSSMALLDRFYEDGSLFGRYNKHWRSPVRWRCLTGEAQMALIWLRLYEIIGDVCFLEAGKLANKKIIATQELKSAHSGIAGGVKGSQPIWGGYMPFSYPNWAAKFLLDSLLLESKLQE